MEQSRPPKDVHELLLTEDEESGAVKDEEILDVRRRGGPFFTPPVIVITAVVVLAVIALIIIFTNPLLREQFQALLAGELGTYKEALRKAEEERVREIENLTAHKYGSVTLFYSPRDARVTITERKFTLDCSKTKNDAELVQCLRGQFDYSQQPEERQIDNPSLHLDRSKKEIVEQLPLNDLPIQEASDDRKKVFRYEYKVVMEREGYYPRKFYITGDQSRPPLAESDIEMLYWIQRGPGFFTVDFRGADLMPTPETAKESYIKARKDLICLEREVEEKRKGGKKISDDAVYGVQLEILNRYGFKTFDEWNQIHQRLMEDKAFAEKLAKELKAHKCQ